MRSLFVLLAPLILAAPLSASAPVSPGPPSFDCAKASTAVERTICRDAILSAEDATMARLYASARISATGNGPSGQVQEQAKWLRSLASCERPDSNAAPEVARAGCLKAFYRERNVQLAIAAIYGDRDLALKTLYRLDPDIAPLVEALVLFADLPPDTAWSRGAPASARQKIIAVLAKPFARFNADENTGYGREILQNSGIRGPADMFKSDHDFAYAIGILGTYTEGTSVPPVFPCKVLLRNPAMIDVEGPFFGSTLDSFIPFSDCQTAMPPLPALEALVREINAGWPNCEGTIRFSSYRAFTSSIDAARIGQPSEAKGSAEPLLHLRGVKPATVLAAQKALVAHYRTNLGMSPAKALKTAHARLGTILATSHSCGD